MKRTIFFILGVSVYMFFLVLFGCAESADTADISDVNGGDEEGVVVDVEADLEVDLEGQPQLEISHVVGDFEIIEDLDQWLYYDGAMFSVKYPPGWVPQQYDTFFDFRPSGFSSGFVWTVNIVPRHDHTVDNIISGMGAQFGSDRRVEEETLNMDQYAARHVVITSDSDPDFYYSAVFIERDDRVYFLANTYGFMPAFELFYENFSLK